MSILPSESHAAITRDTDIRIREKDTKYYTAAEWESHRAEFTRLYRVENRTLRSIQTYLHQQYGFEPTIRQYKRKIKDWELNKSFKHAEKTFIVRKAAQRQLEQGKETIFFRHEHVIAESKIKAMTKQIKSEESLARTPVQPSHMQEPLYTPKNITYQTPQNMTQTHHRDGTATQGILLLNDIPNHLIGGSCPASTASGFSSENGSPYSAISSVHYDDSERSTRTSNSRPFSVTSKSSATVYVCELSATAYHDADIERLVEAFPENPALPLRPSLPALPPQNDDALSNCMTNKNKSSAELPEDLLSSADHRPFDSDPFFHFDFDYPASELAMPSWLEDVMQTTPVPKPDFHGYHENEEYHAHQLDETNDETYGFSSLLG